MSQGDIFIMSTIQLQFVKNHFRHTLLQDQKTWKTACRSEGQGIELTIRISFK